MAPVQIKGQMMPDSKLRWIVFPGVFAGLALHAYICFIVADSAPNSFTVGLFALSIFPYLACLAAGMNGSCGQLMAVCAILPLLWVDLEALHEATIAPTTSTSPLVLIIVPVINFVVLALGFFLGWIVFVLARRFAAEKTL